MNIREQSPWKELFAHGNVDVFAAVTGAGASIFPSLWWPCGASNYLAGGIFTYSPHETDAFLGFKPQHGYAHRDTAVQMAMESYVRARTCAWRSGNTKRNAAGIGLCASVASSTEHRGDHRVHAAIISDLPGGSWLTNLTLTKGVGDAKRVEDEEACGAVALDLLRQALDPEAGLLVDFFRVEKEEIQHEILARPYFFPGGRETLQNFDDMVADKEITNHVFFPGTFNPLHDGHRYMANSVQRALPGLEIIHAINLDPQHKKTIAPLESLDKIAMFRAEVRPKYGNHSVIFTQGEPLFVDKVKKRPDQSWIMGADTLLRLLDPAWGIPTEDVYSTLAADSKLYVFQREWEGDMLIVDKVLNKYGLSKDQFPGFITSMQLPPSVRSSDIRNPK